MRQEVDRLIGIQRRNEQDKMQAVKEVKELKDAIERERKDEADREWNTVSRTLHWRKGMSEIDKLQQF